MSIFFPVFCAAEFPALELRDWTDEPIGSNPKFPLSQPLAN